MSYQPQRAVSPLGTKQGFEDSESREFMKALKQSLLVQTPLQVILETLYSKVQEQNRIIAELKEKVDRVAVKDLQAEEVMARVRVLESTVTDLNQNKLSPFSQSELLAKVDALESKVQDLQPLTMTASAVQLPGDEASNSEIGSGSATHRSTTIITAGLAASELDERVTRCEGKLSGVHNLTGKLLALEHIAAEMGITIPDLDHPGSTHVPPPNKELWPSFHQVGNRSIPGSPSSGQRPGSVPYQVGATLSSPRSRLSPAPTGMSGMSGMSRAGSGVPVAGGYYSALPTHVNSFGRSSIPAAPSPPPRPATASSSGSPDPTEDASSNLPTNQGDTAGEAQGQADKTDDSLPSLQHAGNSPFSQPGDLPARPLTPTGQSRMQQFEAELDGLRRENHHLHSKVQTLEQELGLLKDKLGHHSHETKKQLAAAEEATKAVKDELSSQIATIKTIKEKNPEVSYADLSLLQDQVKQSGSELKQCMAAVTQIKESALPQVQHSVQECMDKIKKGGEPRELDTLFHSRLQTLEGSIAEMRTEVHMAVDTAMDGMAKVDDLQALEDLVAERASVHDIKILASQQQQLVAVVQGLSEQALHLSARAGVETPESVKGAVAMKFRCLTCDQPLKQMPAIQTSQQSTAKGSFLPKLDTMPGSPHSPMGPGVSAAELRRLAEERGQGPMSNRAHNTARQGSPPGRELRVAAEMLEEYGATNGSPPGGTLGRKNNPPRVPLQAAPNLTKASNQQQPGSARTPVFIV